MSTAVQVVQKPTSIVVGLNVGYTVPVGRVAKVKACLNADTRYTATASPGIGSASISAVVGSSNNATNSIELTLRAGDILNSTRTAASGGPSSSSNATISSMASSTVTMTVNGSNAHSVVAGVSCSVTGTASSGGSFAMAFAGTVNFGFVAEEYLE